VIDTSKGTEDAPGNREGNPGPKKDVLTPRKVLRKDPRFSPRPTPLPRSFFARDPRPVARDLLGKLLLRGNPPHLAARIVEVEAYLAENDLAAHSAAGKTARNAVLFGPPGHAYVYFIYGSHYCLNVSCDSEGKGGGILFRALEPVHGIEEMARARNLEIQIPRDLIRLTAGPGRLAQAFGVTRLRDNGCDLTSPHSGLWLADDGFSAPSIKVTRRIGIRKAEAHPLRYILANNPFVSGPKSFR
jgi:DNA-3-methyladenine glycosylase